MTAKEEGWVKYWPDGHATQQFSTTWTFKTDGTIVVEPAERPMDEGGVLPDPQPMRFEGDFQGRWYQAEMDIIGGDSPIEQVMMAVLGMYPGDRLISFAIQRADGSFDIGHLDGE